MGLPICALVPHVTNAWPSQLRGNVVDPNIFHLLLLCFRRWTAYINMLNYTSNALYDATLNHDSVITNSQRQHMLIPNMLLLYLHSSRKRAVCGLGKISITQATKIGVLVWSHKL